MVEVFKTNVQETSHADSLVALLHQHFPGSRVNFDLEDCDKVLRVEGENFMAASIIELVSKRGFFCEELA
jgi:hypothetical protein